MKTIDVLAGAVVAGSLAFAAMPASAASYTSALNACYDQIESQAGDVRTHKMQKVKSRAGGRIQLWIDTRLEDKSILRSFCIATSSGELIALESAPGKWAGKYSSAPFSDVAAR